MKRKNYLYRLRIVLSCYIIITCAIIIAIIQRQALTIPQAILLSIIIILAIIIFANFKNYLDISEIKPEIEVGKVYKLLKVMEEPKMAVISFPTNSDGLNRIVAMQNNNFEKLPSFYDEGSEYVGIFNKEGNIILAKKI